MTRRSVEVPIYAVRSPISAIDRLRATPLRRFGIDAAFHPTETALTEKGMDVVGQQGSILLPCPVNLTNDNILSQS